MKNISLILLSIVLFSCNSSAQDKNKVELEKFPIEKTNAEWKSELTEIQYYVLREAGTERPFSSPLNDIHEAGIFVCAACETPLFKEKNKFDSGTGWPSFDREIKGGVAFSTDNNLGYTRVEEHCATCGGHLGHVFNDGPEETTGKRHCVNGAALKFIPQDN